MSFDTKLNAENPRCAIPLLALLVLLGSGTEVHAGQVLFEANSLCYVSGCSAINTVASTGALTPFASITTFGLATDSQGNVYAVGRDDGQVHMYSPSGTSTIVGASAASVGIALDGAGNLYTTNNSSGTIREYAVGHYDPNHPDSNWSDIAGVNTDLGQTRGITFDAAGNMYIASNGRAVIYKATPNGNPVAGSPLKGYSTPTAYLGGLDAWGLAFDSSGDLYASDSNNNQILEYSPAGSFMRVVASASSTANLGAYALAHPSGIAFDASGNLFVASNTRTQNGYVCNLDAAHACTTSILEFTPDGTASIYASAGLQQTQALAFSSTIVSASSTPEPASTLLCGSGMLILLCLGSRGEASRGSQLQKM